MLRKKERGFRKANRSHLGTALFIAVLVMMAFLAMAIAFGVFALRYAVDERVMNEYREVQRLADSYDRLAGSASTLLLTQYGERDFYVRSADGRIMLQRGEDTCDGKPEQVRMYISEERLNVCRDTELPLIYTYAGRMKLDVNGFHRWMNTTGGMVRLAERREKLQLPYWIAVPVSDGAAVLYVRCIYGIDVFDMSVLLTVLAVGGSLSVIFILFLFGYLISAVVKQRRLTNLFFMDEITGTHNWMWFQIRGEHQLSRGRYAKTRFAVLDIVFVNYRYFCLCHSVQEGEKLLCEMDRVINKDLSKREMCAHYASANFAVLMRYGNREELMRRLHALTGQLEAIDADYRLAFHIGVDPVEPAADANGRILKRRDVDLELEYNNACAARATLTGDDSAIAWFDGKLVEEQKWISIVQEKQQAALDNEEFVVYYQPKYAPGTDILSGAEALIRWQSPEFGLKSPGTFIPIFEKNGFITEIDHYMLTHVARDQRRWLDEGLHCVPVSVNVSRAHFIENDLAEQIRDIVDAAGTPHHLIEIELTESAFFDDKNAIIETIGKLKEYGFTVSMDDFGSGYSSLNSLKDMPLDVLKLDAEFFRGEAEGGRGEIVVSEAIRLAKLLNMRTVAEGVEAREQVEFLEKQGCDMIQGFIYDKPMPGDTFVTRMQGAKPAAPAENKTDAEAVK